MELIDGYAGKPHVEASQVGDFNIGIVGMDRYVLDVGNNFKCDAVTNNKLTIADGIIVNQGRRISIPYGTMENVIIENGSQTLNRNDIVCCHYIKDDVTTIETVEIVVLKGDEATTAKDPIIPSGNIRAGALEDYFPLYRVRIEKISIVGVDTLFRVIDSLDHHTSNDKNPHKVTKAQVGLSNVDNTKDSGKIVSHANSANMQMVATADWSHDFGTQLWGIHGSDGRTRIVENGANSQIVRIAESDNAYALAGRDYPTLIRNAVAENGLGTIKAGMWTEIKSQISGQWVDHSVAGMVIDSGIWLATLYIASYPDPQGGTLFGRMTFDNSEIFQVSVPVDWQYGMRIQGMVSNILVTNTQTYITVETNFPHQISIGGHSALVKAIKIGII